MDFHNSTALDSERLERLFVQHTLPYRHDRLTVRVRYSRGADFSGTCYYADNRGFVNIGRHVEYPYRLGTHVAKAQANRTHGWRETYQREEHDPYQLALFVYLHELYHHLVKAAQRNPRRKEAMCDRFAVRRLVDEFGCRVVDAIGRSVPRERWDFQDVDAFVADAPQVLTVLRAAGSRPPRPIPVTVLGVRTGTRRGRSATRVRRKRMPRRND